MYHPVYTRYISSSIIRYNPGYVKGITGVFIRCSNIDLVYTLGIYRVNCVYTIGIYRVVTTSIVPLV